MAAEGSRPNLVDAEQSGEVVEWIGFLRNRLSPGWRPGEFDGETLTLIPDVSNPRTNVEKCARAACEVVIIKGSILCPTCRREWRTNYKSLSREHFVLIPRDVRAGGAQGCLVAECERSHKTQGLCNTHADAFSVARRTNRALRPDYSIETWLTEATVRPLSAAPKCPFPGCRSDVLSRFGLCAHHHVTYSKWSKTQPMNRDSEGAVDFWLTRWNEPLMDLEAGLTFASACATPFALLPEPLRWEFLYAVQTRDLIGRAHLRATDVRATYLSMRRAGATTLVGLATLGRAGNRNLVPMLGEWQRLIDDAHRDWSGVDDRDRKVLYFRDMELRPSVRTLGPTSGADLRGIEQDWIVDAVLSWVNATRRGRASVQEIARTWTLAAEVLRVRGTPPSLLGRADMNAVVSAVRKRWPLANTQRRAIHAVERILTYGRSESSLADPWASIPGAFSVDRSQDRPVDQPERPAPDVDEPFRFVPQPIIDWLMDHADLLERKTAFLTAEARAMIFVQERCGRRTTETTMLKDDCISYDSEGAPYLEWQRGKPPYTKGKRLPIHQETHDVIRQWQRIKRDNGIESEWLFPSSAFSSADKPRSASFLRDRIRDLIAVVLEEAPYESTVEGADGNLLYFDMTTIDAYSFRHAFAQRLADATDADGRPTTPPEVLQEYMGHDSFTTTMAYFEVTAKRRKKALEAIAPRRIDLHGRVVPVDRERDGFTRIAVTLGHCLEPQNVSAGGHSCMLDHACESCPFFLADPLEREGWVAKRQQLRIKLERARAILSPQHMLDHYAARVEDCTSVIDGIDRYINSLPDDERATITTALDKITEVRRRATAPRLIHLSELLGGRSDAA